MTIGTTLDVDGRSLWTRRRGGGEPILALHGVAGHGGLWGESFLTALAAGAEVIALDHRGTGRSARDRSDFDVEDLAEDAIGVLDALGIVTADVMGFSLGGMVAQELALAAPKRVRSLALLGTAPGGESAVDLAGGPLAPVMQAMREMNGPEALRASWEANVSPERAADDEAFARWTAAVVERPFALPLLRAQFAAVAAHDAAHRLGNVRVPTVVIHGCDDRVIPVSEGERLAGLIPDARLEVLPGAGHLVSWEAPEAVAAQVLETAARGRA